MTFNSIVIPSKCSRHKTASITIIGPIKQKDIWERKVTHQSAADRCWCSPIIKHDNCLAFFRRNNVISTTTANPTLNDLSNLKLKRSKLMCWISAYDCTLNVKFREISWNFNGWFDLNFFFFVDEIRRMFRRSQRVIGAPQRQAFHLWMKSWYNWTPEGSVIGRAENQVAAKAGNFGTNNKSAPVTTNNHRRLFNEQSSR